MAGDQSGWEARLHKAMRAACVESAGLGYLPSYFLQTMERIVASKFGQQKVSVHPLKSRIQADTELLQQFGAAQAGDVRHGVGPRITRLIKFVARETERDFSALPKHLPMIEFIARKHLNLHDESEAKRYTRLGLAKEIDNPYCVSLAIRLGISNI